MASIYLRLSTEDSKTRAERNLQLQYEPKIGTVLIGMGIASYLLHNRTVV